MLADSLPTVLCLVGRGMARPVSSGAGRSVWRAGHHPGCHLLVKAGHRSVSELAVRGICCSCHVCYGTIVLYLCRDTVRAVAVCIEQEQLCGLCVIGYEVSWGVGHIDWQHQLDRVAHSLCNSCTTAWTMLLSIFFCRSCDCKWLVTYTIIVTVGIPLGIRTISIFYSLLI